jgi:hypothetical protein
MDDFSLKLEVHLAMPIQGAGGRPAPPKIGKNMIFWRKIVIFHTKYPKIFRTSLRSARFFLSAPPPNLKSWIRPCNQGYHAECFYFRK